MLKLVSFALCNSGLMIIFEQSIYMIKVEEITIVLLYSFTQDE